MPQCSVFGCHNVSGANKTVGYYAFPKREKSPLRFKKWVEKCRRKNFVPTSNARVCGAHFREEDFDESDVLKRRLMEHEHFTSPRLKPNAVPSKPSSESGLCDEICSTNCKRRVSSYLRKKDVDSIINHNESERSQEVDSMLVDNMDERSQKGNACEEEPEAFLKINIMVHEGIQCEMGKEIYRDTLIHTDTECAFNKCYKLHQ